MKLSIVSGLKESKSNQEKINERRGESIQGKIYTIGILLEFAINLQL